MKFFSLIFFSILTLSVTTITKQTVVSGRIETKSDVIDNIKGLRIELKVDSLVIAKNLIRENNSFVISASLDKDVDVYFSGLGHRETFLERIKATDLDSLSLTFKLPKTYQMNDDKAICQKCHESDQTIPIAYGFKTIVVYSKDQPDYTTYEGYGKTEVFDGGCMQSDISANYYCKRDKIRF